MRNNRLQQLCLFVLITCLITLEGCSLYITDDAKLNTPPSQKYEVSSEQNDISGSQDSSMSAIPTNETYVYDNFEYEIINGAVKLVKCWSVEPNIDIPAVIDGKPVQIIGQGAFYQRSSLLTLTIPSSVTTIEASAFYRCYSLGNIFIPSSVTQIGATPFYRCISLISITVDSANMFYSDIDGVLYNKEQTTLLVYPEAKANKFYIIPITVETIDQSAFGYCCHFLESIFISKNVKCLPPNPFTSSISLTEIIVDPENTFYSSNDGILFDKSQSVLLAYPILKEALSYMVPISIERIDATAFGFTHFSYDSPYYYLKELTILSNVIIFPDSNVFSALLDTVFFVESNSVAEQYAIKYGLNYQLL